MPVKTSGGVTARGVTEIFKTLKEANPNPKSELNFENPFQLLVAVVLSAQATDVGVNKATPALFKAAPTPEKMKALGVNGIKEHIRSIGLYNNKAKNLHALSIALIEEHNSAVPQRREALEKLPGVGRKTANVVMNVGFGLPTLAVDTHVFRVANRTGLAKAKTPTAVEKQLLEVIPERFMDHAHHWLILQGRYTCKAKKPLCDACTIERWCRFPDKGKPAPPRKTGRSTAKTVEKTRGKTTSKSKG